ncbi:N-acetyldiaminopimelate deacetylase [Secundilactobacillus paracollinoides]|uniref:N-acetyldiaminopimelate deacetylase n=1 Tax=Secundilactobacillus paracollinoides TaxID=240427 RepID=UPI0006F14EC3|nr:N-acetyldiaminopimelate deacetylase [Secundilactobacillus paracollinoides]KRL76154.1 M20 M25 M40 family peptidase [Secundilactobacillus paracollinoides DSM 15502 = JCM 11969]
MPVLTEESLIQIRRDLHAMPELALNEVRTEAYLEKVISGFNQAHLTVKHIADLPTALLVRVAGSHPKRTLGYRTDIDALPVSEKTGLPFASKNPGVMHACGHDIHMTVALGVLSYFSEHQPTDNMIFFFQPAEESKNGGKLAYELGVLEGEWRPDEFYGLHDNPDLPAGAIGCRMGTLFAGTTEVNIDLEGKGGHAAYPQDANDMVVAAAQLIGQVQTIISRSIDPIEGGVITLGKMEAGTIRNVIAGHAHIEGTIRGLTQTMIQKIDQRLQEVGAGIAKSFNAQVTVTLNQGGYLPVENDPELTRRFITYMKQNDDVTFIETEPAMTGEDFGYLLSKIPGTMFWLGVEDDSQLHSATLNPDESAIAKGITGITGFLESRMAD